MPKPPPIPGGGGANMQALMRQAQKLQAQVEAAQAELADARVDGTAGGGLVTATVTGSGELVGLVIRPEALDPDDPDAAETVADLVLAAVRDATRVAQELQEQRMGPLTRGLGPGLGL